MCRSRFGGTLCDHTLLLCGINTSVADDGVLISMACLSRSLGACHDETTHWFHIQVDRCSVQVQPQDVLVCTAHCRQVVPSLPNSCHLDAGQAGLPESLKRSSFIPTSTFSWKMAKMGGRILVHPLPQNIRMAPEMGSTMWPPLLVLSFCKGRLFCHSDTHQTGVNTPFKPSLWLSPQSAALQVQMSLCKTPISA